ncbi:MAG: Calx-beta domain-containing protein, partial [Cyanobacteria bacterium P01_F01_bin.153]
NSTTGALTFVEVDRDGGDDGSGNTIDGLGQAIGVTISPDGNFLYATGNNDDAVATFSRNSTTGALTFVEVDRDGGDDGSGNTIDGLDGARFLTTSPDGSFLYVAGQFDDAVATFDTGVTQVAFSAANFTITENSGTSTAVTVTRTGGPTGLAGTSSVVVNVTGGTATPGTDFDNGSFPFTVNFAANATSQTVSIPITDDTLVETGGETITFSLATPTGTSIGTQNTTTLTITDNDSPTPAPTPAAAPIAPPPSGPIRPLVPEATTTPAPDPVPTATAPTVSLPALPGTAIGGTETEGDTLTGSDASEAILGFAGEDTLTGKSGSDFLFGWTGNDLIDGGGGDDFARGGGGDDTLYGDRGGRDATGLGSDTLDGGDGNDVIFGDAEILTETGGDDLLIGGNGNDRLFGQKGDDTLTGNNGADTLNGGVGNDVIFGGDGNDLIDGDIGNDILIGNDGADTFRVGEGSDTIQDFIAGTDVIDLPDGVSFSDLIITTTGTGTQFTATGFLSVTLDNFLGTLRAANFI